MVIVRLQLSPTTICKIRKIQEVDFLLLRSIKHTSAFNFRQHLRKFGISLKPEYYLLLELNILPSNIKSLVTYIYIYIYLYIRKATEN